MEKYHERKTPRDDEYVAAYMKYHSQNKAAQACGVGRETIARAVRRAGIQMDGWKNNYPAYLHDVQKITLEQLREEAKTMTRMEIAQKYGLSIEQVDRRCRQNGIVCERGSLGGQTCGRARMKRYGTKEKDPTVTLDAVYRKFKGICALCGKKTDKTAIKGRHILRGYPTIDHIIPLSKGGSHTWDNVQLAHMACNAGKCDRVI